MSMSKSTSSYVTPGFSWSKPSAEETDQTKKEQEIANPILKRGGGGRPVQLAMSNIDASRTPFSPIENTQTLRRRKPASQNTSPSDTTTSKRKDDELPPKLSILDSGTQLGSPSPSIFATPSAGKSPLGLIEAFTPYEEYDNNHWVLICGFTTRSHTDEILRFFDASSVSAQKFGRSNWLALRFHSAMQAEKALCMQLFSLTDGTMISVHRLHLEDVETKKELDWSNATALFPGSEIKGGKNSGAAPAPADLQRLSESDILLDYPEEEERQSICRKLLGLIFGWD